MEDEVADTRSRPGADRYMDFLPTVRHQPIRSINPAMSLHPPFVVQPRQTHTQTFVLLHGLGSDGEKFGTELLETGIDSNTQKLTDVFPGARFIFPTAKKRRSSAFNRAKINQWFDIASLDDISFKRETQYEGLADSAKYLLANIEAELESIQPEHLILGGLSHGCAMAISLMLGLDVVLGGVIGMSGWLPFQRDITDAFNSQSGRSGQESGQDDIFDAASSDPIVDALLLQRDILSAECNDHRKIKTCLSIPVFIGHGRVDEKVDVSLGEGIVSTLQSLGMSVTWRQYDHGHWYKTPDEIDDIIQFISGTAFTEAS
jgi:predicted esterase